jgi:hypothetical protein
MMSRRRSFPDPRSRTMETAELGVKEKITRCLALRVQIWILSCHRLTARGGDEAVICWPVHWSLRPV